MWSTEKSQFTKEIMFDIGPSYWTEDAKKSPREQERVIWACPICASHKWGYFKYSLENSACIFINSRFPLKYSREISHTLFELNSQKNTVTSQHWVPQRLTVPSEELRDIATRSLSKEFFCFRPCVDRYITYHHNWRFSSLCCTYVEIQLCCYWALHANMSQHTQLGKKEINTFLKRYLCRNSSQHFLSLMC